MNFIRRFLPKRVLPGSLSEADGFVDIDLPLTRVAGTESSSVYDCQGRVGSVTIGFSVCLGQDWSEQQLEGTEATVFWGQGELRSLGEISDSLVGLLALKYGNNSYSERAMVKRASAQVVCLGGDPTTTPRQSLKMKFFFNTDDEKRYAEVFVNLELDNAVVQLHEKDPGYRLPLLRSLTEA
jgi:hypothetical protein